MTVQEIRKLVAMVSNGEREVIIIHKGERIRIQECNKIPAFWPAKGDQRDRPFILEGVSG